MCSRPLPACRASSGCSAAPTLLCSPGPRRWSDRRGGRDGPVQPLAAYAPVDRSDSPDRSGRARRRGTGVAGTGRPHALTRWDHDPAGSRHGPLGPHGARSRARAPHPRRGAARGDAAALVRRPDHRGGGGPAPPDERPGPGGRAGRRVLLVDPALLRGAGRFQAHDDRADGERPDVRLHAALGRHVPPPPGVLGRAPISRAPNPR